MRKIKFRGQDLDTGEWKYGSIFTNIRNKVQITTPLGLMVVNGATLGQFTGSLDDLDKEIYEGDILKIIRIHPDCSEEYCICEVVWVEEYGAFGCKLMHQSNPKANMKKMCVMAPMVSQLPTFIVGNRYEGYECEGQIRNELN